MEKKSEYNQLDSDITDRSKFARGLLALIAPPLVFMIGYFAGVSVVSFFNLPAFLGTVVGISLGLGVNVALIPRLYVVNKAVSAFVTVDNLSNKLVSYGPGFHFSFPWEGRSAANNVSLAEVAESFNFTVQTKSGGTLKGKGSFRLRPDITRLPQFLGGAAAVAADLADLINETCVRYLAQENLKEALGMLGLLNNVLAEDFKHGKTQDERASDFEERFGVVIGDVTVSELLPSEEVQKAMDGASEREALDDIVARNLGFGSMAEVHAAVKAKDLTSEQVAHATENALAMTDNLHGMRVDRQSFTLKLQSDPEIAEAIKSIGPGLATVLGVVGKGRGSDRRSRNREGAE